MLDQALHLQNVHKHRKIINNEDMEKLQKDLDRLGECAVENAMKINPSKSKAVRFTRARVKYPLYYSLMYALMEYRQMELYFINRSNYWHMQMTLI